MIPISCKDLRGYDPNERVQKFPNDRHAKPYEFILGIGRAMKLYRGRAHGLAIPYVTMRISKFTQQEQAKDFRDGIIIKKRRIPKLKELA